MDRRSKLDERARAYADRVWNEGDEPTLKTFRAVKHYKDGALEERSLIRKRFRENLRELQEGHARLKKLIDELEELVNPHSG